MDTEKIEKLFEDKTNEFNSLISDICHSVSTEVELKLLDEMFLKAFAAIDNNVISSMRLARERIKVETSLQ